MFFWFLWTLEMFGDSLCRASASTARHRSAWGAIYWSCRWIKQRLKCLQNFPSPGWGSQTEPVAGLWPDGDGGALRQAPPGALQAGVDLTHLHGSLQPHHLQQLVRQVWDGKETQLRRLQPGRCSSNHKHVHVKRVGSSENKQQHRPGRFSSSLEAAQWMCEPGTRQASLHVKMCLELNVVSLC